MAADAGRRVAAYSKGMRQRIKIALAIAHSPRVLVLDEPLNGLDPMARADLAALFKTWAAEGRHLLISSHVLHEVDMLADRVVLMNQGYVVAEGGIREVRGEMAQPMHLGIRCPEPARLASALLMAGCATEVLIDEDGGGLRVRTGDAEAFHGRLGRIAIDQDLDLETITPLDDDVHAVYEYLIGDGG
jgi:ABC-2 type transport system ATP-binding protein